MNISVIVPTYKPQAYIWDCLNSLANQTLGKEKYEVIIILNGCNEPYSSEIITYIEEHKQVHWVFQQTDTPGVSNARNMAINIATGDYITFVDDDDYLSKECLELLLEYVGADTISICNPWMFNNGTPEQRLKNHLNDVYNNNPHLTELPYLVAKSYFSGPCMKLFPSNYIKGSYFEKDFKNGEDTLYMFLISKRFKYITFTPEDAIYYRRYRIGSAMTTRRSYWVNSKNNIKEMITYIKYYFSSPTSYNFQLFVSRCLGCLYCAVLNKQYN